jgi:hypothetical protein
MNWQKLYAQMGPWLRVFAVWAVDQALRLPQPASERLRFTKATPTKYSHSNPVKIEAVWKSPKALSALQPLYGKGNVEIVTNNGHRVRGIVRSMKTTQALSTPTLKVERADGEVIKIPFTAIVEIINHNRAALVLSAILDFRSSVLLH